MNATGLLKSLLDTPTHPSYQHHPSQCLVFDINLPILAIHTKMVAIQNDVHTKGYIEADGN